MNNVHTLCARAAQITGISAADVLARNNTRAVSVARHAVVYAARSQCHYSFARIGRYLGGRDHSTIVESYYRAKSRRETDPEFAALIEGLA